MTRCDYRGKFAKSEREGLRSRAMYLPTLVQPMSMPSFNSSPWKRGAPRAGCRGTLVRISRHGSPRIERYETLSGRPLGSNGIDLRTTAEAQGSPTQGRLGLIFTSTRDPSRLMISMSRSTGTAAVPDCSHGRSSTHRAGRFRRIRLLACLGSRPAFGRRHARLYAAFAVVQPLLAADGF